MTGYSHGAELCEFEHHGRKHGRNGEKASKGRRSGRGEPWKWPIGDHWSYLDGSNWRMRGDVHREGSEGKSFGAWFPREVRLKGKQEYDELAWYQARPRYWSPTIDGILRLHLKISSSTLRFHWTFYPILTHLVEAYTGSSLKTVAHYCALSIHEDADWELVRINNSYSFNIGI